MKSLTRLLTIVVVLLLHSQFSYGSSIAAGDWVRFTSSSGTLGGGAFTLHDTTNSAVDDFLAFCVQESQYIDYSHDFRVGSITNYADDAGGADPLDTTTAWIMSNASRGLLGAYSPDDIQWSIWKLEGEQAGDRGNSASLIQMADLAVLAGWSNDGVRVLNLFWADGTPAQDQIVYMPSSQPAAATPEPGTLILLGTGFAVLAGFRHRRARARPHAARIQPGVQS